MAGLLAWAADVVGGSGQDHGDAEDEGRYPVVVFTPDQKKYAAELDQKATSLRRSIQDLRLRIPPPDISQRLPDLHAHSLASNAALSLQLNAHSTTRQQAQLREDTLQEENAAYEKAISTFQKKIQEKTQEANFLLTKLKEMDVTEKDLRVELERKEATRESGVLSDDSDGSEKIYLDTEPSKGVLLEQLDGKKQELRSIEEMVQSLENEWILVQQESVKQPLPAQREKILEKQLHSLIEQLMTKQGQAEGLMSEIRTKKQELEKLNGLRGRIETESVELDTARGRSVRGGLGIRSGPTDYTFQSHYRPLNGGKAERLQKLVLLRSAFVLYILALHVLVFIKISF